MNGPQAERFLRARFRAAGSAEDARWQKAYMKSALDFHGVSSAEVRDAARALLGTDGGLDGASMRAIVDYLSRSGWFDVRSAGLAMLERQAKSLGPGDLPWLIDLVRRGGCWAHVDGLATNVVGAIVTAHPKTLSLLPRWARDDDFWVRRTALLAQERELKRGRGDFALFERIAAPMLEEKEFFVRKAIGWVLRETSKLRPELAYRFLAANRARVSGLTLREGAKYLPGKMRAALGLSARGSRRSAVDRGASR
ncbi:MAG TPA: DNA alkylation repair protein [Polyangiaceae bacterium]